MPPLINLKQRWRINRHKGREDSKTCHLREQWNGNSFNKEDLCKVCTEINMSIGLNNIVVIGNCIESCFGKTLVAETRFEWV